MNENNDDEYLCCPECGERLVCKLVTKIICSLEERYISKYGVDLQKPEELEALCDR